jgi:hypothetical protein
MRSEIAQSDQRLRVVAWLLRCVRFPITPTAAIPNDEKTNLTIAPVPRLRDGGSVCHRAPLSLARICGRHVGGRVRLWHHVSDTDERCPSFAASCDTQVALALDSFLSGSRHCLQMQAMAGFFIRGIRMTLPVCELSADDASNSLRAPTALHDAPRVHTGGTPLAASAATSRDTARHAAMRPIHNGTTLVRIITESLGESVTCTAGAGFALNIRLAGRVRAALATGFGTSCRQERTTSNR